MHPMAELFMVSETFVGSLDGLEVEYHKGEVVHGDDPAVKKWPAFFGPVVVRERPKARKVEAATAAPGEKR
jgi:hypothetical protein